MIEKFVPIEEKRRGLVSEDLMNFRWLDDIALSPDGKQIAYTVKQPNAEINGYITHVYVRDVRSGSVQRITSGMTSAWSPAWSRDSRQLAFTFTTSEANWVRIWTVETGETRSYIVDGAPMNSLDWSPDGRTLVGSRWTPIRPEEERGSRPASLRRTSASSAACATNRTAAAGCMTATSRSGRSHSKPAI